MRISEYYVCYVFMIDSKFRYSLNRLSTIRLGFINRARVDHVAGVRQKSSQGWFVVSIYIYQGVRVEGYEAQQSNQNSICVQHA